MPFTRLELVLFSSEGGRLGVLLGLRAEPPFQGMWALPGGALRIDLDADLQDAARRVARERIGAVPERLVQVGAFGGPDRDPRAEWAVSVVYRGIVGSPVSSSEATFSPGKRLEEVRWHPIETIRAMTLAFDHGQLIEQALAALRREVRNLQLPPDLLPGQFTLGDVQAACELVLGESLDKSSFRRRVEDRQLFEPVVGAFRTGAFRPAQLYRVKAGAL